MRLCASEVYQGEFMHRWSAFSNKASAADHRGFYYKHHPQGDARGSGHASVVGTSPVPEQANAILLPTGSFGAVVVVRRMVALGPVRDFICYIVVSSRRPHANPRHPLHLEPISA